MYFYLFCEYAAVIKFQGVIFGAVDNSVKFCNLETPYPLVEICPLSGAGETFAFYLTEEFLFNPPENVSVTDLKGGYFLRFALKRKNQPFRVIGQEKFRDAVITAFTDNGYKISLETQSGFYADTLDFEFTDVSFSHGEGLNSNLIFALFNCKNNIILNVYGIKNPTLLFSKKVDEFSFASQSFTVTEHKKDIAKHVIVVEHREIDGKIEELSRKVSFGEDFDREKVSEKLIPYAFCEEFLCGGDYKFYLSEDLQETADKLKGYFGQFIGVTPPPVFRDYQEVGLIKKIGERKYAVDYYRFDIADNRIINIFKT